MVDLARRLADPRVVVLDGGMGTTVQDRGIDVRNPLWGSAALLSAEGRELNDGVHRDFIAAGAEIIITNTHSPSLGACQGWLEGSGTAAMDEELRTVIERSSESRRPEELCRWINREAMASARRAIDSRERAIAACVSSPKPAYAAEGPGSEAVYSGLALQTEVLAGCDPDLLHFELLTTAGDIEGAALLARRLGLGPIAIGLVCARDGRTVGGVSMKRAVDLAAAAEPLIWYVQCTRYDYVPRALEALGAAVDGRAAVGVYANDARYWIDWRWHGERITPREYADAAVAWRSLGARVIGGCCGTAPEHIAELARRLSL